MRAILSTNKMVSTPLHGNTAHIIVLEMSVLKLNGEC